jgi:nucleoid-associated protein YgaU
MIRGEGAASMSVNKETKIGLAVILGLLVVFGALLVRRIMRSGNPPVVVEADDKPAAKTAGDDGPKEAKPEQPGDGKPTLLSPADPFGRKSQRPDDLNQWAVAGDRAKKGPSESAPSSQDPPAAYSAKSPSKPLLANPDDRYSTAADVNQTAAALLPSAAAAPADARPVASKDAVDSSPSLLDKQGSAAGAQLVQGAGGAQAAEPPAAAVSVSTSLPLERESRNTAPAAAVASGASRQQIVVTPPPADDRAYPAPARSTFVPAGSAPLAGSAAYSSNTQIQPVDNGRREDGKYEVQPNDNYWTIAEKVYGSGAYFRALAEANRGKIASMDRLQPGVVISAPAVAELAKKYPELCPRPNRREPVHNRPTEAVTTVGLQNGGRTYVVQEGDTLFDIARYELGKASRWAEIYELNRDALGKEYDYLTPGMQLALPAKDVPDRGNRTARQTVPGYQR